MSFLEMSRSNPMVPTAQQFLAATIEPVLGRIDAGGHRRAAAQLLLATAIHESGGFHYRRQIGGGPARSYYQVELATHDDIWQNYLRYRPSLAHQVRSLLSRAEADLGHELEHNDNYATAIARLCYRRVAEPLPAFGDLDAMAGYWKRYYNTGHGKGSPRQFLSDWRKYTDGMVLAYSNNAD
jgi:hypothetical protein